MQEHAECNQIGDHPLEGTFAKGNRNWNIQFAVSQKSGNRAMCMSLLGGHQ